MLEYGQRYGVLNISRHVMLLGSGDYRSSGLVCYFTYMFGTDWYGILVMYDMTIHAPWVLQEENVVGMFWGSWLHSYNCGPLKRHK